MAHPPADALDVRVRARNLSGRTAAARRVTDRVTLRRARQRVAQRRRRPAPRVCFWVRFAGVDVGDSVGVCVCVGFGVGFTGVEVAWGEVAWVGRGEGGEGEGGQEEGARELHGCCVWGLFGGFGWSGLFGCEGRSYRNFRLGSAEWTDWRISDWTGSVLMIVDC